VFILGSALALAIYLRNLRFHYRGGVASHGVIARSESANDAAISRDAT
jgi:hypothetical protein